MECVQYLLEQGADPCAETETGDNCLHMAAKNGYTECLHKILEASVAIGSGEPARLADTVIPYNNPVKFVDIRNSERRRCPPHKHTRVPVQRCRIWWIAQLA